MTAARGDTKACIYSGCSGTMQFARGAQSEDALAWLCSLSVKHVHVPGKRREDARQRATAVDIRDDPTASKRPRAANGRLDHLSVSQRQEMSIELRLLVEALDRRVPRLERLGEAQIVGDAAELRRQASALLAELSDLDDQPQTATAREGKSSD
jgi:hypothetical protein